MEILVGVFPRCYEMLYWAPKVVVIGEPWALEVAVVFDLQHSEGHFEL